MKPSSMAKWASNNQKLSCRGVNENDLVMGHLLYQKSGIDFMQNCDLPPPLKVFSGPDKTVLSSMNRSFGIMGREEDDNSYEFDVYRGGENEKLELLKALRLSQTRAREAEKKAESLAKERDALSKAFLEDSLRLFAYRHWMRLLEVQVFKLQSQWQTQEELLCCGFGKEEDDADNGIELSWFVAFAFYLGVVGVGFAFGCKYWF